ncbi:peptidylprolyl isomerase [Bradyrhizobium sp. WD16]|nr:peptidylprolyl isomerase [Bradyrhizobium sp. WD16]UTD25683.1 peptidylprolyl isomerase [Bradyrhizobium sp. WD16]
MVRRLACLSLLLALTIPLGACSKCGWIWEDWQSSSCHGGPPRH